MTPATVFGAADVPHTPHIDAIRASVRAGFRFHHLPGPTALRSADVEAICGFRAAFGAMDTYVVRGMDDAVAARYRLDDLDQPCPPTLWHLRGTTVEVVRAVLALPPHGTPGAPSLAIARPSELWTPGRPWS